MMARNSSLVGISIWPWPVGPLPFGLGDRAHVIGRHQPAGLGLAYECRQRSEHPPHHVAGPTGVEQLIAEGVHRRERTTATVSRLPMCGTMCRSTCCR